MSEPMPLPLGDPNSEAPDTCPTHPLGRAVRLIGDPCILLIVINLLASPKRFSELLLAIGHVSSKTLSQRLKVLEELGCLDRRAFPEIPPRVEYRLTPKGRALGQVIKAIEQFAQDHLSDK